MGPRFGGRRGQERLHDLFPKAIALHPYPKVEDPPGPISEGSFFLQERCALRDPADTTYFRIGKTVKLAGGSRQKRFHFDK